MELGRYFTFQNLINFETQLRTYANILDAKGYENAFELSKTIHNHNSPFDIPISNFAAELNSIEDAIFTFDKIADWINPYSTEKHEFVRENGRLYPYIKRWLDWRDYTEKILTGSQQKEQYLFTIEKEEKKLDVTWLNDYINSNGDLVANTAYQHTEPIKLNKGDTITVYTAWYGIAAISLTDEESSYYSPVLMLNEGNSEVKAYSYQATEDCYVAASAYIYANHDIIISTGNEEQLFDINGEPIITLEGYFGL